MKDIHKRDFYDFDFVQSLIDNSIEENQNMDFKAGPALDKNPKNKNEISKDVAAMANSNGGIIIYGLSEKNHVASHLTFVNGNLFTKESLEQVISSKISRTIPGLKIFPIRYQDQIENTLYVVQIPESLEAPHMSGDNRFYVRSNFQSIAMEEYQVRSLYNRQGKPKLKISGVNVYPMDNEDDDSHYRFNVKVSISNIGKLFVKNYRVNLIWAGEVQFTNLNWGALDQGKNYSYSLIDGAVLITNENPPNIFPGETLDILSFNLDVEKSQVLGFLNNLELNGELYYQNEYDSKKFLKVNEILIDYNEGKLF